MVCCKQTGRKTSEESVQLGINGEKSKERFNLRTLIKNKSFETNIERARIGKILTKKRI